MNAEHQNIIDSHIHLDKYSTEQRAALLAVMETAHIKGLISVSMDLGSCKENLLLSQQYKQVYPAFGFHPEQPVPSDAELQQLLDWIIAHADEMIAVGEVGLPYFLRLQANGGEFRDEPYIELLEQFIKLAGRLAKPVILHAIYEDAPIVCDLLEKHNMQRAHFHWFKGDAQTVDRMAANGYSISITPDVLTEHAVQELVTRYPLEQIMVETDGPWPFDDSFPGQVTNPAMIHHSVKSISHVKRLPVGEVYERLYANTVKFYDLDV